MAESANDELESIREELDEALYQCEKRSGNFFGQQSLPKAPNPCISIEGHGLIGLPLSESKGRRLHQMDAQSASLNSGTTGTEKSCSLAIDGSKILIRNPEFDSHLAENIVPKLSLGLGAQNWTVRPRAELHAMYVCTTNSELVPCDDVASGPTGAFGKLLIFLPSKFTGGTLRLSRDAFKYYETSQLEADSELSTSALAWINGTSVTSLPVLSGYRLVLSYHLINSSPTGIIPSLNALADALTGVRRVLLNWKQAWEGGGSNGIPDVFYFFTTEFDDYREDEHFEEDEDPRLSKRISPLASELGIKLYKAELEIHQDGTIVEPKGMDDEVEFKEIDREEFRILNLATLDGVPVKRISGITFDENQIIPSSFRDDMVAPDKRYFGGIWAEGQLERWYYRKALVISLSTDFTKPDTVVEHICKSLLRDELIPQEGEELVDRLVEMCSPGEVSDTEVKKASGVLLQLATQWHNSKMKEQSLSLRPQETETQDIDVQGSALANKSSVPTFGVATELSAPRFEALKPSNPFAVDNMDRGQELHKASFTHNGTGEKRSHDAFLGIPPEQLPNKNGALTQWRSNETPRHLAKRVKVEE
ncbi:hypothetical protein SCHPADRAFT_941109 [Schizopora paradoxa]|uniref:Uncharacterized protein n=1 Tax=Schizopora paradoxa TaxID=27342 RepID=A0A0H2RLT2_9AGAM|nr:hypothetical protein SCHPADRAFT_941109 [Schizopora paradoxa]